MNERRPTPSSLQTISSVTPAWMHWNSLAPHRRTCIRFDWCATLAPDLHGSTRGWRNNDNNYPSARPQLHPNTRGTHPSRRETKGEILSDRQQQGHMEGCRAEGLGLPLRSARHTHTHTHTHTRIPYTLHILCVRACTQVWYLWILHFCSSSCRQWRCIRSERL